MARYEATNGNVIIAIDTCDCGSTGGCEKCRPIIFPKPQNKVAPFIFPAIIPFTYQYFVREFKANIDAHPEWGISYI